MGCTQAGFEALAREIRQAQRRQEAMLERRRQRVEDRKRRLERGAIVDNGPVEDLVEQCEDYLKGKNITGLKLSAMKQGLRTWAKVGRGW